MKYELDILDRLNVYNLGTITECTPSLRLFLDEEIDINRLRNALDAAFVACPYFKTRLFFDGRFCLSSNPDEFVIHHCPFDERPKALGKESNGYLFQISYFENELAFDYTHVPSDALGFFSFVQCLLHAYFGTGLTFESNRYTALPFEENSGRITERPISRIQEAGFLPDRIAHKTYDGTSHCTFLSTSLSDILHYGKRVDASPAAVISALTAVAFRNHLKKSAGRDADVKDNNNVRGKIVASSRKILDTNTVHNCYSQVFITYTDRFDQFDFSQLCTVYRAIIDLAVRDECVLFNVTDKKREISKMEDDTDQPSVWKKAKTDAVESRKKLCNFNFSYLGTLDFGEEEMKHITDIHSICINENCEFGIFAYALRDRMYFMISENYHDRDVLAEWVETGNRYGINIDRITEYDYQQVKFDLGI